MPEAPGYTLMLQVKRDQPRGGFCRETLLHCTLQRPGEPGVWRTLHSER